MTPVVEKPDRVHVLTPGVEWTILRGFEVGRGPCAIADVRERHRPWRELVTSSHGGGFTLNDPLYGGLFGFGLIAAMPGQSPDPDQFWNWAWEITTRLKGDAFGITASTVSCLPNGTIDARASFAVRGRVVLAVFWQYRFGPGDEVRCDLRLVPAAHPSGWLWMKEPKIVANGIEGMRQLVVRDRAGEELRRFDLTRKSDPARSTFQIPDEARHAFVFSAEERPTVTVTTSNPTLDPWTTDADQATPMSDKALTRKDLLHPAPAYCLNDGRLWARSEVPRWGKNGLDVCGLAMHGWEGGYGAPDCWNTFRPWPTRPARVTLTCRIG